MLTGGTDVHLVLVDLRDSEPELTGKQAEDRLHEIEITVNRNAVPFDPRPPMEASGLRIGTPALATRGLQREDFAEVGEILAAALTPEYESRARRAGRAGGGDRRALSALRGPGGGRHARVAASAPPDAPAAPAVAPDPGACDALHQPMAHPNELDALYAFLVGGGCDRAADAAHDAPRAARSARSTSRASAGSPNGPTPLLGGLAIFAGALVATLIWLPAGYVSDTNTSTSSGTACCSRPR